MRKRRSYSAEFKAKVAIEALKEQQTLQQLAQKHEVHPNHISCCINPWAIKPRKVCTAPLKWLLNSTKIQEKLP